MPEQHLDVKEQIQKMGEKWSEFQTTWINHFKDMDVEVKDWHFSVGKAEKEYNVEVTVKLAIKPKK